MIRAMRCPVAKVSDRHSHKNPYKDFPKNSMGGQDRVLLRRPILEAPATLPGEFKDTVLVVFSGQSDLAHLRFLKKGFKHCFVLIKKSDGWTLLDPLSHILDVGTLKGIPRGKLMDWLKDQGMKVVEASINMPLPLAAPWMPYSCVEVVKRVLGIRDRRVFTPWQLHQYLCEKKENQNLGK